MSVPFEKLHLYLQQKKTDCSFFNEYLLLAEKYTSLHHYLTQRLGTLNDYFIYLENLSSQTETAKKEDDENSFRAQLQSVAFLGSHLLFQKKVTLEELNQILSQITLDELNSLNVLQKLFSQRKIGLADFCALASKDPVLFPESQGQYEIRCISKRAEFICKSASVQKIFGHYQLLEELGRGAMGIVYKAYHPGLNRFFALKIMTSSTENAKRMQRFFREIQVLAKLEHPGIVRIFDSGQEGETLYLVMELIEGIPLSKWLQEEHTLREKISFFQKLLESLHAAHIQGILHRDLKPDNIFVAKEAEPKIMDFGLARDLDWTQKEQKLTQTGAILGTPAYMSPEQAKGETDQISARSDIYAIGVCLYEALTGRRPFVSKAISELFQQIITQEPLPPSKRKGGIHPDLDTIVLKALEKDPNQRYVSAQMFARDLDRFLSGYPIQSKSMQFNENLRKWYKRNQQRLFFYGLLSLLITFLILGGLGLHYFQRKTLFKNYFCQASNEYLQSQKKNSMGPSEKLYYLLQAFKNLSLAQIVFSKEVSAESLKWKVGQDIVALTCEMGSYYFSDYISEELAPLTSVSEEEKQKLRESIQQKQEFLLNQHLHRFHYWKQQLIFKKNTFRTTEALFELSKMSEKEIIDLLLEELNEGTSYHLRNTPQNSEKTVWYHVVASSLGRMNNPYLGTELWKALKTFSEKLEAFPEMKKEWLLVQYMTTLSVALSNSKIPDFAPHFQEVRLKMGEETMFWRSTKQAFLKLLRLKTKKQKGAQTYQEHIEFVLNQISEKDYLGAIETSTQAIQLNSKPWEAYNSRGNVKSLIKDFAGAISDYNLALQWNPNSPILYDNRGRNRLESGDFSGAIQDLTLAIEADATYRSAYVRRGTAKIEIKDYEGAIQDLNVVIQMNPEDAEAYMYRGNAKQSKKDFAGAIADYTLAIQFESSLFQNYNNRGVAYMNNGDIDRAIDDFTTALEKSPQYEQAYFNRGNSKVLKKDISGAIQDFSEAIRLNPDYIEAYFNRGNYRLQQNQQTEAVADFQKFLELSYPRNDPQTVRLRQLLLNQFPQLKKRE
ncbi:MAG: protein kinase [Planctomycetota bacterium]